MALVLAACGSDDSSEPDATSTTGGGATTADTAPGGTDPTGTTDPGDPTTEVDVRLYFARGEELGVAGRTVTGPGVAREALADLVAGTTAEEAELGLTSAVPDGTEVLGVDIADGLATVDLSDAFTSGGGSLSMSMRVAQVVFTLTQFDTVDRVTIRIGGEEVDGIGGEGVPASDLTRADFEDQSPAILLESPYPGQTVSSPIAISGTANTFEATYQWAVLDAEGEVLAQGFDTATSGSGTRGTFAAELPVDHTGPAVLKVFESSAKDGSEINVVDIPVTIG